MLSFDKVDGEMADLLQDCSQKLGALTEEIQEKETSTEGTGNTIYLVRFTVI